MLTVPTAVDGAAGEGDARRGACRRRVTAASRTRAHVHVVRRGDSLWTIAHRHGMDVNTLARLNGMDPADPLRAGQRLKLTRSGSIQRRAAEARAASARPTRCASGDTRRASRALFQVQRAELLGWNDMSSKSRIMPGQKLHIHLGTRHT